MYIRNLEKQQGERNSDLSEVNSLASSLLQDIKELQVLFVQLQSRQHELQKWDVVIRKLDDIERRQNDCIQQMKQDREVLLKVSF